MNEPDRRLKILVLSENSDTTTWHAILPSNSVLFVRWKTSRVLDLVVHRTLDAIVVDGMTHQIQDHLIDLITLIRVHAPVVPMYFMIQQDDTFVEVQSLLEAIVAGGEYTIIRGNNHTALWPEMTSTADIGPVSLPPNILRMIRFWRIDMLRSQGYTYGDIAAILGSGSEESIRKLWQRGRLTYQNSADQYEVRI